jgi:16S rRNA (cytosine967-C5)-methyltransferase
MQRKPSARGIAARVLERVDKDGAYAAAALASELDRHPQLDPRERALATELVYGVLRTRGALLRRLERHAPRGLPSDSATLAQLCLAAYQLLLLDRIPGFAAVDAAVEAVRRTRGARLAGFANAVLRKLAASRERLDRAQAVLENVPAWLRERLESGIGLEQALALLGADNAGPPPIGLRLLGSFEHLAWLDRAEPGKINPAARLIRGHGDPKLFPGYAEGAFAIQEEGAQVVALSLGARAGERVLDACAGRGQKTSLLVERVTQRGAVVATDCYPAKLEALRAEHERLHLRPPEVAAVDWTVGPGPVPADFDRVLVDAPCTGIGTARRRPEIISRLESQDPARLGALAARILRAAATRARPSGRVVFAVCSVLEEECERVTHEVADLLEPAPFDAPEVSGLVEAGQSQLRLLPGRHGTDGYFIASFRRRA